MDVREKALTRLERIEIFIKHRMKEVHWYTKATFELFAAVVVIGTVFGVTFVRELWRSRKAPHSPVGGRG